MEFELVQRSRRRQISGTSKCFLVNDSWDDFGFRTSFELVYFDSEGKRHDVGVVKIMQLGMADSVEIPERFEQLSNEYCSLGNGQEYYEAVCDIPAQIRNEILIGIRDCVLDQPRFKRFLNEAPMLRSLLRSNSKKNVTKLFPSILVGKAELTAFNFGFHLVDEKGSKDEPLIDFKVVPHSLPPTNIHVLIGRNGVGKTRILAGIANAVSNSNSGDKNALHGEVHFYSDEEDSEEFSNLVVVSFSNFDRFDPIPGEDRRHGLGYHYVGFKKCLGRDEFEDDYSGDGEKENAKSIIQLKSIEDLVPEFSESLAECLRGNRLKRWSRAMDILSSDPVFEDIGFRFEGEQPGPALHRSLVKNFESLSSGHKIVLLTTTKLVECVNEKSLVLLDEPETHLHPPLLGSFVRALSELLINRNGVAIVATHSPVVLQEVPRTCVTLISRSGNTIETDRPLIETFAENVGVLTREVFNLELLKSGFHQILADAAAENNVQEILQLFNNQIGGEGRALVRAIRYSKEK